MDSGKQLLGLQQKGITLIEVMVAMLIGLFILVAVSQVLINSGRIRNEVESTGRQLENGAFALNLLRDELNNAGFWGESGAQEDSVAGAPPLCPETLDELTHAMANPVQGTAAGSTSCETGKGGGASITIRRASSCALNSPDCQAVNQAYFYIQVPACAADANIGTAVLKRGTADLTALNLKCDAAILAPIYRYLSRIYYLTSNDELVRMELGADGYSSSGALVDGVEGLHFSYGLDTDGDAQVDEFNDAPTPAQWPDVIAVRIWLVARNLEATPGYTDTNSYSLGGLTYEPAAYKNHKRQIYSTTVFLKNVGGPREVQ